MKTSSALPIAHVFGIAAVGFVLFVFVFGLIWPEVEPLFDRNGDGYLGLYEVILVGVGDAEAAAVNKVVPATSPSNVLPAPTKSSP